MSVNSFTTAFSMVAIGDPVDCNPIESEAGAVLAATSSDAIQAGFGVDLASGAMPGYKAFVQLPASAAGIFHGIVPRTAIPTPQEAALLGTTAGQIPPGRCFGVFDKGKWRVPITVNVTAGQDAYLIYSGADAGKWTNGSGGVSQITRGTVVPNNGDAVGLDVDALPTISVTSTASASATATLIANAWNASAQHAAVATASTDTNDVLLTFLDFAVHTVVAFSPATADITPIANDQAAVAATARAIAGALWARTTTAVSGAGVVDLGD